MHVPLTPHVNATWAAMGRSLGTSSTKDEDIALNEKLNALRNRIVVMIGDSTLRNQFLQLVRIGLAFPRDLSVAKTISMRNYQGSFSLPGAARLQSERPDSSNAFWGGFPWMVATTPSNTTFAYAKLWGCSDVHNVLRRIKGAMIRHGQREREHRCWPPDLVLWNFGLHLLHVYPARPVATSAIRCAMTYKSLLQASARALRAHLPYAKLFYRSTNAVCDERFDGAWAVARHAHHCALPTQAASVQACQSERIARLQLGCQQRYNISRGACAATFMDNANSRSQHETARILFSKKPGEVHLFDAFTFTQGRCDATVDGRHYPRLLAAINQCFLVRAAQALGSSHPGIQRRTLG